MGVSSVKFQLQVQRIFERYEVRPTFVLDYPVSSRPEAYEIIRDFHRSGEPKTDENTYPGNLPFELERENLAQLSHVIHKNVGVRPRIDKPADAASAVQPRAPTSRIDELVGSLSSDVIHAHSPVLNALPASWVGRRRRLTVVYEMRASWEDAAGRPRPG